MTAVTTFTRCKKHFSDISSTVGVCASCLRERLFFVIATHTQSLALARTGDLSLSCIDDYPSSARPPEPPPPLAFPRSVSPYFTRRRRNDDRFYHTPQAQYVGDTTRDAFSMPDARQGSGRNGRWRRKLTFLRHLLVFRSRSNVADTETDHNRVTTVLDHDSPESSPSLFSHLAGRRKKWPPRQETNTFFTDDESSHGWTARPMPDRGLPSELNASSSCRGTPAWVAGRRKGRGHPTEVVGIRFCLSPLVRASTAGRRRGPTSEVGYSIDVRVPAAATLGRRRE